MADGERPTRAAGAAMGGGFQLDDPELVPILAYPTGDAKHLEEVRRDLHSIGVESIFSYGRISIGNFWALGKGWVGVVCLGIVSGRLAAIKLRRADADRPNMLNEARMHQIANSAGVGPELIAKAENALAMEYVDGLPVIEWLEKAPAPETSAVRGMVSKLLDQCFRLDSAGLDHGELSQSKKHVLVDASGNPFILDFESAGAGRITRNVMAMTGYLFYKSSLEAAMRKHFSWDKLELWQCLKDYKASMAERDYRSIREAIGI